MSSSYVVVLALAGLSLVSIATYVIQILYLSVFCPSQNLRVKYSAKWALVTGGTSGIGKALVERLARQDISVVVVGLGGAVMDKAMAGFK